VTSLETETICPLIRRLQVYNNDYMRWDTYESSMNYAWITAWTDPTGTFPDYTASSNSFTVYTEDFDTFDGVDSQPSNFQLRMVVQDHYSKTASAIIYDYFNVQIRYECDTDSVTLSQDMTRFIYLTGSGPSEFDANNWNQQVTGCAMEFVFDVWNTDSLSWVDLSSVSSTANADYPWATAFALGKITVEDATTYAAPKEFKVRVTYTSLYSKVSSRSINDEFFIRLTSTGSGSGGGAGGGPCDENIITKSAEVPYWLYTVSGTSTAVSKTGTLAKTINSCLLTQYLYVFDEAGNNWVNYSAAAYPFLAFTSGQIALADETAKLGKITVDATRTSVDPSFWKPDVKYTLKLVITDPNAVTNQEIDYIIHLELKDICSTNTLTKVAELPPTTTFIFGDADTPLMSTSSNYYT
jgi:hypothetical protein